MLKPTYIDSSTSRGNQVTHTNQKASQYMVYTLKRVKESSTHSQCAVLKLSTKILSYITVVPIIRNVSGKHGYPMFMYYKCWQKSKGNQFWAQMNTFWIEYSTAVREKLHR